jgi:hypothetical protein
MHNKSVFQLIALIQVYGLLKNNVKLINIYGPRGIGKTEIALKVAQYASERNSFTKLFFLECDALAEENSSDQSFLQRVMNIFGLSRGVSDISSAFTIEEVVESIREISVGQNILFIIDGADYWLERKAIFFNNFIKRVRQRLGDSMSILITSLKQVIVCR